MRRLFAFVLALAFPAVVFAQSRPVNPDRPEHPKRPKRCCATEVVDATGAAMGELLIYDWSPNFQEGQVRYDLKDGSEVLIIISYDSARGTMGPGGSNVLFTSNDCSGDAFVVLYRPQLMRRQAVVLNEGVPSGGAPNAAWLYVAAPNAMRAMPPPGTVFHSQWDMWSCSPYPAPGYTMSGSFGGFWMKRVENIFARYKRPYSLR